MKIKNYLFAKAGFAFLCSTACCAFFNYMTYVTFQPVSYGKESLKVWMFLLFLIQVSVAIITVIYGDSLIKRRRFIWEWHGMDELPMPCKGKDKTEVVFVTVDGCLFNGLYLHEEQVFHGYDSLDFKPDEILAWSTCQFYVQIKDRYYFPDGSEWTTDDGDC